MTIALVSIAASSCTIDVSALSMTLGEVVWERPAATVGPDNLAAAPWRTVILDLPASQLASVRKLNSTLHFQFDDCASRTFAIDEVYVAGYSLNELSSLDDSSFAAKMGSHSVKARGVAYLSEAVFSKEKRICAHFSGGSMLGAGVRSTDIVVKK